MSVASVREEGYGQGKGGGVVGSTREMGRWRGRGRSIFKMVVKQKQDK